MISIKKILVVGTKHLRLSSFRRILFNGKSSHESDDIL